MNAHMEKQERGQVLVIVAAGIVVLLMISGLVLDGGFGLAQRRSAQNAADLAALAGARVLASFVSGDTVNGTDANVVLSIDKTIAANKLPAITYGAPDGPRYVDINGNLLPYVGSGTIPASAAGVSVRVAKSWKPFFAGLFGVSDWSTHANATARGGYRAGGPPPGNILPIGVSKQTYDTYGTCAAGTPTADCDIVDLTEGTLNVPGGFGWLKFGCGHGGKNGSYVDDLGNEYGLGQTKPDPGCDPDKGFLVSEWGNLGADPPIPGQTFGCCTEVGLAGSGDDIGSYTGNTAAVTDTTPGVSYYITNEVVGFVPIWDTAGGTGTHGYYHIIGFAGFQITHVKGAHEIQGILRQVIFPGPVSTTAPGFAGAPLATQLIR
jgi:hypothetical protein